MSLLALLGLHLHTLGLAGPLGSAPKIFYIVFSFLHYLFSSIYFWVVFYIVFFFSALFIFFYLFLSNFLYSFFIFCIISFLLFIVFWKLNATYWTQKKSGVQISLKTLKWPCNRWVLVRNPDTPKEFVQFVHEVRPVFAVTLSTLSHMLCRWNDDTMPSLNIFTVHFVVIFNFTVI